MKYYEFSLVPHVSLSDDRGPLPGYFDTAATGVAVYEVYDAYEVSEYFGHIYEEYAGDRPITMEDLDYVRKHIGPTDKLTSEEKLAKIEEMMHPGYWGALDGRREAILKVLGSTRREWKGGNPFE